ncbi:MAG: metal-dependent hydrolase [Protaetiibacter sp.]
MALPTSDTHVTYPDGDLVSTGAVLHVQPLGAGRSAIVLDRTAFHPVDTAWPDQPADRGSLRWADGSATVVDAVTGGIHEGELLLGAELSVRMGTAGWTFVVGHVIEGPAPAVGETVEITVEAEHRHALSAGHTACHLASLALDAALAGAWSKPVATDARGNPAFDELAIQTSRIEPFGSLDVYRVGKSLRRKGFDPAALEDPDAVAARADAALAGWVAAGARIRIERDGDEISTRRGWVCELPDGVVRIPCGGTHLTSLADVAAIRVTLEVAEVPGGLEVRMRTVLSER